MTSTPPTRKTHTAGSAAILLMLSAFSPACSRSFASSYVNYLFGAGVAQDAYRAAFKLPDLLTYFLIGGAASVCLITMLNRYREKGDDDGGDRALSVILTTMFIVLGTGILLADIFAPRLRLARLRPASSTTPPRRPLHLPHPPHPPRAALLLHRQRA